MGTISAGNMRGAAPPTGNRCEDVIEPDPVEAVVLIVCTYVLAQVPHDEESSLGEMIDSYLHDLDLSGRIDS